MKNIYIIIFIITLYIFNSCVDNNSLDNNIHEDIKESIQNDIEDKEIIEQEKPINSSDIMFDLNNVNLNLDIVDGEFIQKRIRFPNREYKRLRIYGGSRLKGAIYSLNLEDNRTVYPNIRLYLNPVTSYSKDWYINSYIKKNKMTKVDDRLFNYLKFTNSKKDGTFSFFGLPKGKYYLIIKIDILNYNKLIVKKVSITQYNNYIDIVI